MDNSKLIILLLFVGFIISLYLLWMEKRSRQFNKHFISSFLKAASIPSFKDSIHPINNELSRARRFEASVSVLVIQHQVTEENVQSTAQNDSSSVTNIFSRRKGKEMNWANFLLCGTVIRDALRNIDLISFTGASYQYIIVLPETTRTSAELLQERLKDILGNDISNQLVVGISEFPKDGLIIEDLVGSAPDSINNRKYIT